MMLKKFLTLTAVVGLVSMAEAQDKKFKFGVHIDPTVSFLTSNDESVKPSGANFAFRFGIQGDLYLGNMEDGKPTYAITFGTGFIAGVGGSLTYESGGILLPKTELTRSNYADPTGTQPQLQSTKNLKLTAGTEIKYNVNYVPISTGFKITTAEFGDSYLRAFFHLPTIDILIPVSAGAKINAPTGSGFVDARYDSTATPAAYAGMYSGDAKQKNIYKDIFPIQVNAGVGAGVEWSPDKEGGIRLIGGFYYSAAVLDITNKIQLFDSFSKTYKESNPRTAFHNISLRIGVIF